MRCVPSFSAGQEKLDKVIINTVFFLGRRSLAIVFGDAVPSSVTFFVYHAVVSLSRPPIPTQTVAHHHEDVPFAVQ